MADTCNLENLRTGIIIWHSVKGGSADQSKFEIPSDRVWGFRFAGNQGFFRVWECFGCWHEYFSRQMISIMTIYGDAHVHVYLHKTQNKVRPRE